MIRVAVVSIVTGGAAESDDTLPATSVARALMLWELSVKAPEVICHAPADAVLVPIVAAPSSNVMVAQISPEPLNRGVVIFVILSVLDDPLSSVARRSGTDGVAGATVSIVTESAPESADTFPATSVAQGLNAVGSVRYRAWK